MLTLKGWRDLFLLVFLHVESRKVYIAPSTFHPDEQWTMQQTEAFLERVKLAGLSIETLMHDRDSKFAAKVDDACESASIRVMKSAYRSPNTNAFVERFIQTLQVECLDKFVVFGEPHMDYLVKEFVEFYHEERPHQGKDNVPLVISNKLEPEVLSIGSVACRERLGGALKHYCRQAACEILREASALFHDQPARLAERCCAHR